MIKDAGLNPPPYAVILMGAAATLLGVGLARFAFTAIFPGLILQGWFTESQTAYIASSNLVGYILGAWSAAWLVQRLSARTTLLVAAVAVAASFLACAYPLSFGWMLGWRTISGWAGAVLMVVAPPLVMSHLPVAERASARAVVFTGLGVGILLSGSLVPWLVEHSLRLTWWMLFALAVAMSLWMFRFAHPPSAAVAAIDAQASGIQHNPAALLALYVAYGLDAIGFVPHTVFWFDFLVRTVGLSLGVASFNLALLGVGAMLGALVAGALATRFGWARTIVIALSLKMLAVALPVVTGNVLALCVSALLVGAFIPGMVVSVSGRIGELTSARNQIVAWGRATMLFAICQGIGSLAYARLYVTEVAGFDGRYLVFALSALSLSGGVLLALWSLRSVRGQTPAK